MRIETTIMPGTLPTAALILGLAVSALAYGHGQNHGIEAQAKSASSAKEQQPWGIAGDPGRVNRSIVIRMSDAMRFHPDRIRVRVGEMALTIWTMLAHQRTYPRSRWSVSLHKRLTGVSPTLRRSGRRKGRARSITV